MSSDTDLLVVDKSQLIYTSCYCEENIWKLCEYIDNNCPNHLRQCFVIFISNANKMVPIWKQRAGNRDRDYLCVWDYHVVMIYAPKGEDRRRVTAAQVYDFDTVLSFPVDFETYSALALKGEHSIGVRYRRLFRILSAEHYLRVFASDRSHMKGSDGNWLKSPPPYPCIRSNECDNNLNQFISMDEELSPFGEVLNLSQLNQRFAQ